MVTNNFITECKNGANANRLGKITVTGEVNPITSEDKLASFSIEDSCYVDGSIIGTTYLKKLTADFVDTDSDFDLLDKNVQPYVGVKYSNNTSEWLKMGNYTVEKPTDEQTANLRQITA